MNLVLLGFTIAFFAWRVIMERSVLYFWIFRWIGMHFVMKRMKN